MSTDDLAPQEAAILRALLGKDRTARGVRCVVGGVVVGALLRLEGLAARGLVEPRGGRWRLTTSGRSAALAAAKREVGHVA